MNGKKGESGGNDEELRGFYFLKTFNNKVAAISTHCETAELDYESVARQICAHKS